MATRKNISKKTRFEVFKRDSFKCQYCGRCAPEVILHVDHIHPVSKGGENDILNYITACAECNGGKSDRLLSDDSVMAKQRAQLEELNQRREQLEQMLAWRDGMRDIDGVAFAAASEAWHKLVPGYSLNDHGEKQLKKVIEKFGLQKVLTAIDTCANYLEEGDGKFTHESVALAFSKIGGICRMASEPDWKRDLYYIRGIARNRFTYVNQVECLRLLEEGYHAGLEISEMKSITLNARNWTAWHQEMCSAMGV
ncbi:HNH endonuclease [Herbaspirillum sp.]|uniref:HNH endonuclease n=1 Tax=Herbaspirillum sp. TaxID=1890675 RepID=UPI000C09F2FB|nr:HNH endonuclease [Herbaspirillum sp.]MAF04392.1 HNH endonuclease [Herbaspirillum sp.]